jgi:hypothetical protein
MSRDDFKPRVKLQIAQRAAYTCSNPKCQRRTLIPEISNQTNTMYVGVASHITAASLNGPRYDVHLTKEQRASIENGIHLCQLCGTQVDANGGNDYPAHILREWKIRHEAWLREQQNHIAEQRREYSKRIIPYFTQDIIYDFVPGERASGYIILPEDTSSMPSRYANITGRIDKTIDKSTYWVAISPQLSSDSWWPQGECVFSIEGFWKVENAVLGRGYPEGEEDIGRRFDIGLYETTPEAHKIFQDASINALGVQRPKGTFLLWKISVMRTA